MPIILAKVVDIFVDTFDVYVCKKLVWRERMSAPIKPGKP